MKSALFLFLFVSSVALAENSLGTIGGYGVNWGGASTITIDPGAYVYPGGLGSAVSTSTNTITMPADLDQGTEASNQWYAIYMVQDNDSGAISGLYSTNYTAPTGEDNFWLVGSAYNNSGKEFRKFMQSKAGKNRMRCFHADRSEIVALPSGSSTNWTSVSFDEFLPPDATIACLEISFKSTSAGVASDKGYVRMSTDGAESYYSIGIKSDNPAIFHKMSRLGAGHALMYRVDNTNNVLTIVVTGYIVEL